VLVKKLSRQRYPAVVKVFLEDMTAPAITRRSLLLAGAGAVAGAALRPHRALAALGPAQPQAPRLLGSLDLGPVGPAARTVALGARVAVVGLQWQAPAAAAAQVRVRLADGTWGPWVAAGGHGHGPDTPRRPGEPIVGEPLWTGGSRQLQLRSPRRLSGARLHLIGVPDGAVVSSRTGAEASLELAQPVLTAGSGQPPIIARTAWAQGTQPPRVAPEYGAVRLGFVHHTENPNGYAAAAVSAMLRAIYVFHRDVNGWNDIGYNFVIDLYGRVFEARAGGIDEPVVGAHAGGYNLVSTGVAVLGSFTEQPISAPARNALQRLLAWKLSLHGTPSAGRVTVQVNPAGARFSRFPARARVSLPRIAGHRDADSTDCPGAALYGELPGVRRAVAALAGQPLVATLTQAPVAPAPPPPPPQPASPAPAPAPAVPQLLVTVGLLGGAPLAGVPVLLQARTVSRRGESVRETTLAEGVTDAAGRLLVAASFAAGAAKPLWVRALCPAGAGHGAGVSPALKVAPLPALSPPAASAPTP
jgi:N-acetylmuramoyl-L-alanine amidase